MQIGVKTALGCLAIAAFVPALGWWAMATNGGVRTDLEAFRHTSIGELVSATDMVLALEQTHGAAQALLAQRWREASGEAAVVEPDRVRETIRAGLDAADGQLHQARKVTEAALALAEQEGDARRASVERLELSTWLDRLSDELATHRAMLATLIDRAPADPAAATRLFEAEIEPHYRDVVFPLIEAYQDDAERELAAGVDLIDAALRDADRRTAVATAVATVLAVLGALGFAAFVTRPIVRLRDVALRALHGDWTARMVEGSPDEIGILARGFNHLAEHLQSTAGSKGYVDDVLRSMSDILVVTDRRGLVWSANRAAEERLGRREADLIGRHVDDLLQPTDVPGEFVAIARDGSRIPVVCHPTDLHDDRGRLQGQVWVAQDIRVQKEHETVLRHALEDVHHRFEDNLHVVSTLLRLQVGGATAAERGRLVAEGQGRWRAASLLPETDAGADDGVQVDFRTYVAELVERVVDSAGAEERSIRVTQHVEPGPLDLDVAIPCALLLNELLSNAMRHAYPGGRGGTVRVAFQRSADGAVLTVADDGAGPVDALLDDEPRTSGMRLVRALARQLRGELSITGPPGTCVTLSFPLDTAAADVASSA